MPETTRIFTPDDVVTLNAGQRNEGRDPFEMRHPFTCPNRGDGGHRDMGGDLGALYATTRGWICPFCDYTQGWAHSFMLAGGTEPQP